jgi:hypothetical protein
VGTRSQAIELPASLARAASASGWCDVVSSLDLRPGRYEVRVAALDERTGRAGSVFTHVEVTDVAAEPMFLSGLQWEFDSAPVSLADSAVRPAFAKVTAARTFTVSQRVQVRATMRLRNPSRSAPVTLRRRLINTEGQTVDEASETVRVDRFDADGWTDVLMRLPVEKLGAGDYLFVLEASGRGTSARQTARVSVR